MSVRAFRFDRVGSTNEVARRLLAEGAIADCAYVVAREQTAGRGTRGRSWSSPRDAGVYLSLAARPACPVLPSTRLYTLAAGVACAEAIAACTDVDVRLKPVNDLYAADRKLGGVLTETTIERGAVAAVVIGVGINVRSAARGVADAVCIEELAAAGGGRLPDVEVLAEAVVARLVVWSRRAEQGAADLIRRAWIGRALPGAVLPEG